MSILTLTPMEKNVYAGVLYDFKRHGLPGFKEGTAYIYDWDARLTLSSVPSKLKESAWQLIFFNTEQSGNLKNMTVKLHYAHLNNRSSNNELGQ